MRISDVIAAYIQDRIDEDENGSAELQRNGLAERLGCVPSQINYVITSRFGPEQGYQVESRRGGGGYIRITRLIWSEEEPLLPLIEKIGEEIDQNSAWRLTHRLAESGRITQREARLMAAVLSDQSYREVLPKQRDRLRATMMKQMLAATGR